MANYTCYLRYHGALYGSLFMSIWNLIFVGKKTARLSSRKPSWGDGTRWRNSCTEEGKSYSSPNWRAKTEPTNIPYTVGSKTTVPLPRYTTPMVSARRAGTRLRIDILRCSPTAICRIRVIHQVAAPDKTPTSITRVLASPNTRLAWIRLASSQQMLTPDGRPCLVCPESITISILGIRVTLRLQLQAKAVTSIIWTSNLSRRVPFQEKSITCGSMASGCHVTRFLATTPRRSSSKVTWLQ